MSVYAYRDANSATVLVDSSQINFTGTWVSTGTYAADTRDAVLYGTSQFIAIVDNINVVPTYVPRRSAPKWSSLVVVHQTSVQRTANEAYDLAATALETALGGTHSYSTQSWGGTIAVDMSGATYQRTPILGDTQIEVENAVAVRKVTALLVSQAGTDAALTFPDDLVWFGSGAPATLPAGKRMELAFTSFGTVASEIHAVSSQQV